MPGQKRKIQRKVRDLRRNKDKVKTGVLRNIEDLGNWFDGGLRPEDQLEQDAERMGEDFIRGGKRVLGDVRDKGGDILEDVGEAAVRLADRLQPEVEELFERAPKKQKEFTTRATKLDKNIAKAKEESPEVFNKKESSALSYLQKMIRSVIDWLYKKNKAEAEQPSARVRKGSEKEPPRKRELSRESESAQAERKAITAHFRKKYPKPPEKELPQPHQDRQPHSKYPRPNKPLPQPHQGKGNIPQPPPSRHRTMNMGRKGRS